MILYYYVLYINTYTVKSYMCSYITLTNMCYTTIICLLYLVYSRVRMQPLRTHKHTCTPFVNICCKICLPCFITLYTCLGWCDQFYYCIVFIHVYTCVLSTTYMNIT